MVAALVPSIAHGQTALLDELRALRDLLAHDGDRVSRLEGDPYLNLFGRRRVIGTICSMPGTGRPVDPYQPTEGRYPAELAADEVAHGAQIARRTAALPTRRADRLFCIRGVGYRTIGAINWNRRAITLRQPLLPGDGIQPAWGTRLAALPASQCITVAGAEPLARSGTAFGPFTAVVHTASAPGSIPRARWRI